MSSDSHWRTANRLYSALAVFWERHRQFLFPRIIATFTLKASKSNREGSSGQSRLSILMIVEVSRNGPGKNTIALHLNSFDRLWITFGATHPWYTLPPTKPFTVSALPSCHVRHTGYIYCGVGMEWCPGMA